MTAQPRSRSDSPRLHWDGTALNGSATSRTIMVTVPARLVSFRCELLPPAPAGVVRGAAKLKAERAFSALGAIACDALISTVHNGRITALLMALPQTTIAAINRAATARGIRVTAIRVAELCAPIPVGGLIACHGDTTLIAADGDQVRAVQPCGQAATPSAIARERLRLGIAETAPALPALGNDIDFIAPSLDAPTPWRERPGVRTMLGVSAAITVVGIGVAMWLAMTVATRNAARATADALAPNVAVVAMRQAELTELAAWFEHRPAMAPGVHALAMALPPLGAREQVRLVRVRQVPGSDAVVEAWASDRSQMLAFIERLRRDPRVSAAEVRSSRTAARDSAAVAFDLIMRLESRP